MSVIYAFLDIETTGLDPAADEILEIAWQFTDEQFNHIGSTYQTLVEPDWQQAWSRIHGNEYVHQMHTDSGLLDDGGRTRTLDEVHDHLAEQIDGFPPHHTLHLAGASVHFDRDFLTAKGFRYLLEAKFHHRILDLSAVKLLFKSAGVEYPSPANARPHRAMYDVWESVEQARIFHRMVGRLDDCRYGPGPGQVEKVLRRPVTTHAPNEDLEP